MPKQIYKVFQFHGGLNNDADPRDVAENELADLKNVAVDKLGRIVILGDVNTEYKTIASSPDITTVGGGVKAIATDYDGLLSGSADTPGQVYYLVETSGAITGLGEDDDEDGTITVGSLAGSAMYYVDGALRIYSSSHTTAVTPQWRGYIPGVLYGTIDTADATKKGHIYNSGPTNSDKWYTKGAQIKGCFEEVVIGSGHGLEGVTVGLNLIMASRNCKYHENNTGTAGEPVDRYAFANETCATGTGPTNKPGNQAATASGMYWGHAIGFEEGAQDDGSWAPNGTESYQFYCTTIYDGIQESLPQLFTMYPASEASNEHNGPHAAEAANNYGSADPLRALRFGHSGAFTTAGQNISLFMNPTTKWCGAEWDNTGAITDSTFGPSSNENLFYNFGAVDGNGDGDASLRTEGNPRITGIKVYWASDEDGFSDLWQLYEWDFAKGFRALGSDAGTGASYSYTDWSHARGDYGSAHAWYHHPHASQSGAFGVTFKHPPRFIRYDATTGHSSQDIITVDSFKTSVVANNRTYIGHVKIDGTVYGDRMLKSPPNEFDKFPVKAGHIDVIANDGDEIIALFEHADRILQFKKNILYIINVSGAAEFLESEHKFKGITNPGAACKTDYGIAWVNQNGCYIYDGQKVTDLLERQGSRKISLNDSGLSGKEWNTFIGTGNYHRIGYNPAKRQLVVKAGTASAAAYVFDMVTSSWTYSSAMVTDADTNSSFINDPVDGKLLIFDDSAETFDKWVDTPASAPTISIITKDLDFGAPGVNKNVYKVYITYTGGTSQNCAVEYAVDGSGSFSGMSADLNYTTNTTQQTASITPSSAITDAKSFQLKISGTAATTFELNDISIVYRVKGAR